MEIENAVSNGYHGGHLSKIPETQLQKCSDAQIDMNFTLEQRASLKDDAQYVNIELQQSIGPGSYHLDNTYGCDCKLEKAREVQLSQPAINFNGGKGWMGENGCLIDNDSKVRFDELTNKRFINQLPNLQNQGFFGKGDYDVGTESLIRSGNLTKLDRPCNVLAGSTTLPYSITPMIPQLHREVQDTKHIVPEDSMDSWVRGGLPSRQIVRNADYMKRCQEKNQ
jgi:hypothetical protein